MKTYIGISRDHSASMRPITKAAAKDYIDNKYLYANGERTSIHDVKYFDLINAEHLFRY